MKDESTSDSFLPSVWSFDLKPIQCEKSVWLKKAFLNRKTGIKPARHDFDWDFELVYLTNMCILRIRTEWVSYGKHLV